MSIADFRDAPTPVDGDTPLSPAEWRIVSTHFGDVIFDAEFDARFGLFDPYKKGVLVAVLTGLLRGVASRTQAEIAERARCSVRCVRKALRELEQSEVLCAEGGDGTPVTFDLGRRLTAFLREFAFIRNPRIWRWSTLPMAERLAFTPAPRADRITDAPAPQAYPTTDTPAPRAALPGTPDIRADRTPAPHAGSLAHTPAPRAAIHDTPAPAAGVTRHPGHDGARGPTRFAAAISPTLQRIRISDADPVATSAREIPDTGNPDGPPSLIKKNKNLTSSSLSSPEGGPTPAAAADPTPANGVAGARVDAATSRRLALDALAAHFVRSHPGIPVPRTCDAGDVRLVEACAANASWDAETLRQTHADAIDGAFEKAPPDRPPTPRYIWGQFRFFLAHAALGRTKRLRAEAKPKPKAPRLPEEPASFEWLENHMRAATDDLASLPSVLTARPPRREFH